MNFCKESMLKSLYSEKPCKTLALYFLLFMMWLPTPGPVAQTPFMSQWKETGTLQTWYRHLKLDKTEDSHSKHCTKIHAAFYFLCSETIMFELIQTVHYVLKMLPKNHKILKQRYEQNWDLWIWCSKVFSVRMAKRCSPCTEQNSYWSYHELDSQFPSLQIVVQR